MKAIFATDEAGGMGLNGGLPWPKMRGDLAHFARTTEKGLVIMGRGTYESSMPMPLPNRKCVVLSRTLGHVQPGVILARAVADLDYHIQHYRLTPWVIGGGMVLRELWSQITEVSLTVIDGTFESDTHFDINPDGEFFAPFLLHSEQQHPTDPFRVQHWIRK